MEKQKKPVGKNQYMKKKLALLRNKDRPIALACYICGQRFIPVEGDDGRTGLNFQNINEVNGGMYALCGHCADSFNNYIHNLKHNYEVETIIRSNLEKLNAELIKQNNTCDDDQTRT